MSIVIQQMKTVEDNTPYYSKSEIEATIKQQILFEGALGCGGGLELMIPDSISQEKFIAKFFDNLEKNSLEKRQTIKIKPSSYPYISLDNIINKTYNTAILNNIVWPKKINTVYEI